MISSLLWSPLTAAFVGWFAFPPSQMGPGLVIFMSSEAIILPLYTAGVQYVGFHGLLILSVHAIAHCNHFVKDTTFSLNINIHVFIPPILLASPSAAISLVSISMFYLLVFFFPDSTYA